MPFTNYGAQALAWALGSQIPVSFISHGAVGTGSGTAAVTNLTLITETDRNPLTGSASFTESRKAAFQVDFSTVEMSGTQLREFGFLASGAANMGSVWFREAFPTAITFDGTNELQITLAMEVMPG